jgi:hypothetical protein
MLSEVVADWNDDEIASFTTLFTRFAADFERYAADQNATKPRIQHA